MKIFVISAIAALAFVYHASAQAQAGPGSVKIDKIEPQGIKTPEFQIQGGPQKRSKIGTWLEVEVQFETKPEDIDELTFTYTIMIENKLLDGAVTLVAIPKGRDHYSVVYIAPRTLEKLTGGRPLSGSSIQNVWVVVSRQGQVIDQQAFKPGPIPNLPHLAGMVLNKGETPFAPLFYDRYEAIKATR